MPELEPAPPPDPDPLEFVSCSIDEAASLFGLSDLAFNRRFIWTGLLVADRYHQLPMKRVLAILRRPEKPPIPNLQF